MTAETDWTAERMIILCDMACSAWIHFARQRVPGLGLGVEDGFNFGQELPDCF